MPRTSRRLGASAQSRRLRVLLVLCVLALPASRAHALLLYDNGPITDGTPDGRCDSGFTPSCGGSGDWTFYDDFNLGTDATVTGFDYADFFLFGSPANYVETEWSLFDADPFTSAPIASGIAAALLSAAGPADLYWFEVGGLAVGLSAGVTYWLGIHNRVSGEISTTVARVGNPGGGLDAAKQGDTAGNDLDFPILENRAFRVHGTPVPEPSTILSVGFGLVALAAGRRRRVL